SLDTNFAITFASTFHESFSNAALWANDVLNDGRILANAFESHGTNAPTRRLVRLLPTGALDPVFEIPNSTGEAIAQHDGRILIGVETNNTRTLYRLNSDGSPDAGFIPLNGLGWGIALQNDGKILVDHFNSLLRLNPDGSRDNTFSPPPSTNGIDYFLP